MHIERDGSHRWFPVGVFLAGSSESAQGQSAEFDTIQIRRINVVRDDGSIAPIAKISLGLGTGKGYVDTLAMQQISTFIIKALVDTITGGAGGTSDSQEPIGIYRSGPKIEQFFLDCGIDLRIGASSRVPATTDCLRNTSRLFDGEEYIKRLILKVCDPREYVSAPEKAVAVREHVNRVLEPDGLAVVVVGGKAHLTDRSASGVIVEPFIIKVAILDFDTVQIEIARALLNLTDDPEDAVTAACSLIEAVCRSILVELRIPLPAKLDIEGLLKAVQEPLGLSPGRTDLPKEIEQDVRQILGGLTSVAKGIGALRTHGGDAHGKEKGRPRLDPRIARLAINASSTIALFLIETWERKEHRALPQHGGAA